MIEPDDFPRLDSLLAAALERPPDDRGRWVTEVCGENGALRNQLERLIALATGGADVLSPSGGLQGPIWEDFALEISSAQPERRAGERMGRYEVRGLLGVGGMGRVYRAFDPVLAREVAIKALSSAPDSEAAEGHRRLEREARLLAGLSHPNIAAIYGFERIDGAPCLVLELVEGQTLAERLQRGALSPELALGVALQVAEALEAAHRKGVVHRDLKPANVKLSPEGRVKVLDFGIAKPVARGPDEQGPEPAGTMTERGVVLGTAPYMSPEQARGEAVDTRTDVWAFGCLLYEILTGAPVFKGTSSAEVVASVLRDDVDWGRLPAATPAAVRRLLRRCLQRELRDRLQDIGDARLELSELDQQEVPDAGQPRPARFRWLALSVAAVTISLLGFWFGRSSARSPREVARLSLELPAGLVLANDYAAPFALSPDGRRLALLARQDAKSRLFLRDIASLAAVPIPGTEDAWQPSFSPDGRSLVFFADRKLKKVSLDGGPMVALADIEGNPRGASWGADGTIVVAPSQYEGLTRLDANGDAARPLTHLDLARGESSHRWPQVLPGGHWVLFTVGVEDASFDDARLEVVSLDTGERRRVLDGGAYGRYGGGRLFYVQSGRAFAVRFDLGSLALRGAPEVVLDGVRYDPRNGAMHFALSESGTLVYGPSAPTSRESYLAWIDAAGNMARIENTPRQFQEQSLSPDGHRIAARIGSEAESDLWIFETGSATLLRLSFGLSPHRPRWTPDGRGITVAAEEKGRWSLLTFSLTGAGPPVTIFESPNRLYPGAWSADGRLLLFQERRPETGWDLRVLPVGPDGRAAGPPRDLAATRFQERNAALSPDGRLFAYESDEVDGVIDVYVARFDDPGTKARATGSYARWPRFGTKGQLYFWYPIGSRPRARPLDSPVAEGLHRVDVRPEAPRFEVGQSLALWAQTPQTRAMLGRLVLGSFNGYDVDLAGASPRFLVLETSAPAEATWTRPAVALSWFDDLSGPSGQRPR